jgi:NAD(P)-dependent dehydrogenase (short-subunit alcohol dehydrogenase family)
MSDKHVLVTGASGGLGAAVVKVLTSHGWDVTGWSHADVDLTNDAATLVAVEQLQKPLHAIVHLVGGIVAGRTLDASSSVDFDMMVNLNLRTTFSVLRHALPLLSGTRGAVVTIGASAAVHPASGKALYGATKAGVIALTLALAEEGKYHGVRASCIVPHIIDTPANHAWGSDDDRASWVTPNEIADAITRLIDPSSSITGTVIPMYGRCTP